MSGLLNKFVSDLLLSFLVAMGVVIGGSMLGGLATLVTGELPLHGMKVLAGRLRLWGTIAALGGSFAAFRGLESSLVGGPVTFLSQIAYIVSAFSGGHLGYLIIRFASGS